jgi:hypothetical protein
MVTDDISISVHDPTIIKNFVANPDNTFLVSFPRTGSHWLRMVMELYFERPSLVRVFYYPECTNYLTLHTHDLALDLVCSRVIYLYRDPIDTIYSQLRYHGEDLGDHGRIIHWSDLYGRHLDKWLYLEGFTTRKTILTYERMKQNMITEFGKVTRHFDQELDRVKLADVTGQVTKHEVKRKTMHDSQVVKLQTNYQADRQKFRDQQGEIVWENLSRNRSHLLDDFQPVDLDHNESSSTI